MYIKFVYIAIKDHCIRTNETKFSYKNKNTKGIIFLSNFISLAKKKKKEKKILALKPVFILSRYLN